MAYLHTSPLDMAALLELIRDPSRGGIVTFVGAVRDHDSGRPVVALEYSAYAPMAEAECGRIVAEATQRWPVRVALAHRVGRLEPGDVAVIVAAAASHRDAAFEAARWVIDEVKRRVPIWKREHYHDGAAEWIVPVEAVTAE